MSGLLSLCSVVMGILSLVTFIQGRTLRRQNLFVGSNGENKVVAALRRMGFRDVASNFVVSSRKGKQAKAQIDVVVRIGDIAVIIEAKTWSGVVSGGAKDEQWTVLKKDGTRIVHGNPLSQAARQARLLYEGTGQPAVPLVMMVGSAVHDSGAFPQTVTTWATLRKDVVKASEACPRKMKIQEGAWERVTALAADLDASRSSQRYGALIDSLVGKKPWLSWLAIGAVAAAAAMFLQRGTVDFLESIAGFQ